MKKILILLINKGVELWILWLKVEKNSMKLKKNKNPEINPKQKKSKTSFLDAVKTNSFLM